MADEEDEISFEELQELFAAATDYVKGMKGLSDENKLIFYGFFKQVSDLPHERLKAEQVELSLCACTRQFQFCSVTCE